MTAAAPTPFRPWPIRTANALGRGLERLGRRPISLDPEALLRAAAFAEEQTGADFSEALGTATELAEVGHVLAGQGHWRNAGVHRAADRVRRAQIGRRRQTSAIRG